MTQSYLLPEQAFVVLGMLLCWIILAVTFFENTKYNILQFVFILLPASIGIVSFGLVPIAAILNIIPALLHPDTTTLVIEGIGLYITFCTFYAFKFENNQKLIK